MNFECATSFKELAQKDDLFLFSRAVFDETKDYLVDGFDKMINANGELKLFCELLEKNDFYRQVRIDGKDLSLNYLKNYEKKDEPLKKSFGEKSRLGIEISYEDIHLNCCVVSLRLPFFKDVLLNIDALSSEVKTFVENHTKTCDGCRYCVQTDKSGTKPLAAISVGGVKKCPYYPSFSFRFTEFSKDLANEIWKFFEEVMMIYGKIGKKG